MRRGTKVALVAGGIVLVVTDSPLRWVGTTAQRLRNRLRPSRPPLTDLPERLVRERDLIVRVVGERWKRALSASLGNGVVEVLQVDTADGNVLSTSPLTAKRTSGGVSEYTHTIETPDADDAMTTVPVVIDQREGSVQIIVQVLKED
mgnify:CR=1 FL=1